MKCQGFVLLSRFFERKHQRIEGIMKYIIVLSFEDYNPRKDRKKHSWFRVDNSIIFSRKLFSLNASQKWLWICIISLASQDQRNWISLDHDYLVIQSGTTPAEFDHAIKHFEKMEMIRIVDEKPTGNQVVTDGLPNGGKKESYVSLRTDGRTDDTYETDGQTDITPSTSDFSDQTKLELVSSENLKKCLAHVPKETQKIWLQKFGDPKCIATVLEKCILKRASKGHKTISSDWEYVFTTWLFSERPESFKKEKPILNLISTSPQNDKPHPGGEDAFKELMSKLGVKSLVDAVGKNNANA